MFGEVNAGGADVKGLGDFAGRPAFGDVEIENLKLSFVNPAAKALQGLGEKVRFPGGIPRGAEL